MYCLVLVCVLPYSKYSFAMALPDATIPQLIKALNCCLQYFEGVPLSLKTDNMKQVVTKSCRYEPLFSEVLQQWALHYNITLLATRVAKPKDKGAVENEVKIAYQRIYVENPCPLLPVPQITLTHHLQFLMTHLCQIKLIPKKY